MDFEQMARELLRELRGQRSQVAWSRRLGYKSNVAYAWESGRRWPTAAETLRACGRTGIDVREALTRFYAGPPPWLTNDLDPASPVAIAAFLTELRGNASISDLARRAELSRYRVTRWVTAQTQPRLPDFLRIIEASSVRVIDFIASFVDPTRLPTVAPIWEQLEARRHGAARYPWSQAVLRALELQSYRKLPAHDDGWIADRLGTDSEEVAASMELLKTTGAVRKRGKHWSPAGLAVDTRRHPEVSRQLKEHWTAVAGERIAQQSPGQFSYNVFTVSRADFERIRELHLAYYYAVRQIVAESETDEVVAVANVQLFPLDTEAL